MRWLHTPYTGYFLAVPTFTRGGKPLTTTARSFRPHCLITDHRSPSPSLQAHPLTIESPSPNSASGGREKINSRTRDHKVQYSILNSRYIMILQASSSTVTVQFLYCTVRKRHVRITRPRGDPSSVVDEDAVVTRHPSKEEERRAIP